MGASILSQHKLYNLIRYNISEEIWINYSGRSILKELRKNNMGIRDATFYKIRRLVNDELADIEKIRSLNPRELIPLSYMTEQHNITMTNNAQYRFKFDALDPSTGEFTTEYRAISSNQHMTKQQLEDGVKELFSSGGEKYNYIIDTVELINVWIRPGARLTY